MANSPQDTLNDIVVDLVEQAREVAGSDITQITVDVQHSGELPYRITDPNDLLPHIGLAFLPPQSAE